MIDFGTTMPALRAAQALELRDGDGAFVEVAAVGGGDVAPAAARRLCFAGEFDRLRQNLLEFLAPIGVLFFAVNARQKQQPEPVAVHVAGRFGRDYSDCRSGRCFGRGP